MSIPSAVPSEVDCIAPGHQAARPRVVFVWRLGSRAELDAHLHQWQNEGWRVERCVPRVVEGPAYGALVVLRRDPNRRLDVPPSEENGRLRQQEDLPVVPPSRQTDAFPRRSRRPSSERGAA